MNDLPSKNISILLVEDEPDLLALMELHLRRNSYQVDTSSDGGLACQKLQTKHYHLVILDWMIPTLSGIEICQKISKNPSRPPILMVTARAQSQDIIQGLEEGADDYLTKPFEIPIFLARVKALLRRGLTSEIWKETSEFFQIGELSLDQKKHRVFLSEQELNLTLSEFKILSVLMKNPGRVLSRSHLIEALYDGSVQVTDRTIDTHMVALRKKLGDYATQIESVRGVGYRIGFFEK